MVDFLKFEIINETEAMVVGYNKNIPAEVTIPKQISIKGKTYIVTEIGEYAFQKCKKLSSITIPNSVTRIGQGSFVDCSNLTNIIIPNSVTKIENSTFNNCKALTSITLPDSITEIGYFAFWGCSSLKNITLPQTWIKINSDAFRGCIYLKDVTTMDKHKMLQKFDELLAQTTIKTYTHDTKRYFGQVIKIIPAGTQVAEIGIHKTMFYKLPQSTQWGMMTGQTIRSVESIIECICKPFNSYISVVKTAMDKLSKLLIPQKAQTKDPLKPNLSFEVGETVISTTGCYYHMASTKVYFWKVKKINKASLVLEPLGATRCYDKKYDFIKDSQEFSVRVRPTTSHESVYGRCQTWETKTFRLIRHYNFDNNKPEGVYNHKEYGIVGKYNPNEVYRYSFEWGV